MLMIRLGFLVVTKSPSIQEDLRKVDSKSVVGKKSAKTLLLLHSKVQSFQRKAIMEI